MGEYRLAKEAPAVPGLWLLTAVEARKDEGNSPTGIVGRSLARQLLAASERVRVLAEPAEANGWPPGVEVIEGSIVRPREHAGAFDGVDGVFLAGAHPSTIQEALMLARNAGVGRIVLLSSHGPEYEQAYPPETWFWLAMERAVEAAGIAWTHIRPSAVMGAAIAGSYPATGSDWPDTIRAEGVVREAVLEEGHYPFIHENDLAAVVAAALLSDRYTETILEAVGLPLSTRSRIRSIANALGRDIGTVELTAAESRAIWRRAGWPDGAIDVTLYALHEYGVRLAELTRWTLEQQPSVQDIIGRPLRTYDDWAVENADAFR